MGFAYLCLILSISEITSVLPFAGGSFVLARCTISFYAGFIVGCLEILEYITYVSSSVIALSQMICTLGNCSLDYQPVIWLCFYIFCLILHIIGGRIFWYVNNLLAVISIGILLIYCLGSLKYVNFQENAMIQNTTITTIPNDQTILNDNQYFVGGISTFFQVFPLAAWFFVGIESVFFAASRVKDPKYTMPRGAISGMCTLFVTSILVLFISASLPPGLDFTSTSLAPLNVGFSLLFELDDITVYAFSIPATFATAFGFMLGYGALIQSMAEAKLFPLWMAGLYGVNRTPYIGLLVGSLIGYCLCLVAFFVPIYAQYIYNMCILSGFISYITQCYGYYRVHQVFDMKNLGIERSQSRTVNEESFISENKKDISLSTFHQSPFGFYGA